VLPKDGVAEFDVRPDSATLRDLGAATLGLQPDDLISVFRAGLGFLESQRANEDGRRDAQVADAAAERNRAIETVRQVSAALEQEKLRTQSLRAEINALRSTVADVERKYADKARAARKVAELYDDLRKVYRRLETDLLQARHVGADPVYAENPRSPPGTPAMQGVTKRGAQGRNTVEDSPQDNRGDDPGVMSPPRKRRQQYLTQPRKGEGEENLMAHSAQQDHYRERPSRIEVQRQDGEGECAYRHASSPEKVKKQPLREIQRQHQPPPQRQQQRPRSIQQQRIASTYFGQTPPNPTLGKQRRKSKPVLPPTVSIPGTAQPAQPTRLASPRANIFDLNPDRAAKQRHLEREAGSAYSISPDAAQARLAHRR
jgi:hypothetical protein